MKIIFKSNIEQQELKENLTFFLYFLIVKTVIGKTYQQNKIYIISQNGQNHMSTF